MGEEEAGDRGGGALRTPLQAPRAGLVSSQ